MATASEQKQKAEEAQQKQNKTLEKIREVRKKVISKKEIKQGFTRRTLKQTFGEAVGPAKTKSGGGSSGPATVSNQPTQASKTPVQPQPQETQPQATTQPINQGTSFKDPSELSREQSREMALRSDHFQSAEKIPSTITAREKPKGIEEKSQRFIEEKSQQFQGTPLNLGLGVASSVVGNIGFAKQAVIHPIKTFKGFGSGIVELGKNVVSGEGMPKLGSTLRNKPFYSTGFVLGEILTAKGVGVATKPARVAAINKLEKFRKTEITGKIVEKGKEISVGSKTNIASEATFEGSAKTSLDIGGLKLSKKEFPSVKSKVTFEGTPKLTNVQTETKVKTQRGKQFEISGKGIAKTRGDRGGILLESVGKQTGKSVKGDISFTRSATVFDIKTGKRSTIQKAEKIETFSGPIIQEKVAQEIPVRIEGITKVTEQKFLRKGKTLKREEIAGSFEQKLASEVRKKGTSATISDVGLVRAEFQRPITIQKTARISQDIKIEVIDYIPESHKLESVRAGTTFQESFSKGTKSQRELSREFSQKAQSIAPQPVLVNPSEILGVGLPSPQLSLEVAPTLKQSSVIKLATGFTAKQTAREAVGTVARLDGPKTSLIPVQSVKSLPSQRDIQKSSSSIDSSTSTKSESNLRNIEISKPALQPALQPSLKPALQPSLKPALQPALQPSLKPALQPALKPTLKPTLQPTAQGSFFFQSFPSIIPTKSSKADNIKSQKQSRQLGFSPTLNAIFTDFESPFKGSKKKLFKTTFSGLEQRGIIR